MTQAEKSAGHGEGPLQRVPARGGHRHRPHAPGWSWSPRARAASASRRSPRTWPPPSPRSGLTVGVLDADVWGFSIPRMLGVSGRLEGRVEGDAQAHGPARAQDRRRRRADRVHGLPGRGRGDRPHVARASCSTAASSTSCRTSSGATTSTTCSSTCRPAPATCRWAWPSWSPAPRSSWSPRPRSPPRRWPSGPCRMARKSFLRVAGVIENMSAFTCDHGESYALFGSGGGADPRRRRRRAAARPGARSSRACRPGGDSGEPVVLGDGARPPRPSGAIAERLVTEAVPPAELAGCSARMLDAAWPRSTPTTPRPQRLDRPAGSAHPQAAQRLGQLAHHAPHRSARRRASRTPAARPPRSKPGARRMRRQPSSVSTESDSASSSTTSSTTPSSSGYWVAQVLRGVDRRRRRPRRPAPGRGRARSPRRGTARCDSQHPVPM